MFLKEIHAEGFKSFAKKTIISFDNGLVGFVGPNGSGKSNINDAIRWALGEKSLKKLRGQSSSDVIFSGSSNIKKSKFAEVSLIFDNSENLLNTEYKTVKITRRVFRNSGENEYYINQNKVRLKEIRNLILDTGLGNSSLSIISQGTISKIAEAKPLEVRTLLDEAAGVSKYQIQKSESIRKLERVQQNLEIMEVTYNELKKQVKPLLNQSEKAGRYLEYKENLKDLELALISKELSKNKVDIDASIEGLDSLKLKRDLNKTKISNIEKSISVIDQNNLEIEKELRNIQVEQNSIHHKINNIKSKEQLEKDSLGKESYKEKVTNLISFYNSLKKDDVELKKTISDIKSNQFSWRSKVQKLESEISHLISKIAKAKYEIESLESSKDKNKGFGATISYLLENKGLFPGIIGLASNFVDFDKNNDNDLLHDLSKFLLTKIVVDKKNTAVEIVNFLSKEKKGRVDIISQDEFMGDVISAENEILLSNMEGYQSTLLKYHKVHKTQLKSIIDKYLNSFFVFDNFENALKSSKIIKSSNVVVSLDGFMIKNGLIISGGGSKIKKVDTKSMIEEVSKQLNDFEEKKDIIEKDLAEKKISFENIYHELSFNEQKINNVRAKEEDAKNQISILKSEYLQKYGSSIDIQEELSIHVSDNKEKLLDDLETLNSRISFLNNSKIANSKSVIDNRENLKSFNEELFSLMEKISKVSSQKDKLSSEASRYMEILNTDYKMTYDNLMSESHKLKVSSEEAHIEVNKLRSNIKSLGYINLESIEVYKTVSERYEEIKSSFEEIRDSRELLLDSISKLDIKMLEKFSCLFDDVNEEFEKIYSSTFNGGSAKIEYTDPDNILESGIDIIVKPKNKNITNISLFSGGEKAMISLAFIFSILTVKKVPFLIMDEAEASLDEANVERYGNFCRELNTKTQVILVTHRPGTMELCDILYGVTMEGNEGITKILSVKLSEAKEFIGEE